MASADSKLRVYASGKGFSPFGGVSLLTISSESIFEAKELNKNHQLMDTEKDQVKTNG
jgi:hypothetical protein